MENKENLCKSILGIPLDNKLVYDEVIEKYVERLLFYATYLDDIVFSNIEIYENLSFCLHYCTCEILYDYFDFEFDLSDINNKASLNKHCQDILISASEIVKRFNFLGLEDVGSFIGTSLYIIADAVYNFEYDLKYNNQKVYS